MTRQLRVTDILTQILPGRLFLNDCVVSRTEVGTCAQRLSLTQIAQWSLYPSSQLHPIVEGSYTRLDALAVLQVRNGAKTWEVAHLFAVDGAEAQIRAVLLQAGRFVSSRHGERLFIRLPYDSDEILIVKETGFREAFVEDVYGSPQQMAGDLHTPPLNFRPSLQSDAYGIFRLYSSVLSSSARSAVGLTFDQWRDSREAFNKGVREYVWEHDHRVAACVRLVQRGTALIVDAMLHPDSKGVADALVMNVAQLAWGHREPVWVVPLSQPGIAEALVQRGWQHLGAYTVLVHPLAIHAEDLGLATASV